MEKVFVRLKDPGSTFIVGRVIFVGKKPMEVELTKEIQMAVRAGALVKLDEDEYKDQLKQFNDANGIQVDPNGEADKLAKEKENKEKEAAKALEEQEKLKLAGGTQAALVPEVPVVDTPLAVKAPEDMTVKEITEELTQKNIEIPKKIQKDKKTLVLLLKEIRKSK